MRDFRPDLLHLHTVVNPEVLEWAAGVPALVTVQDHRYFCPGRGKWTLAGEPCGEPLAERTCAPCFEDPGYAREILALTRARLAALGALEVVVLSGYMKRELVAAGLPSSRLRVIPPFVHGLSSSAPAEGPPCALFVGRLVPAKGVLDAVEAWRLSGLDLPLAVAGAGPLRAELAAKGCELLGWLDRGRLSAAYRRARVLLLPPRWQEPFGIAGLEALSLGVPVAAWDSGGVREWHPGPLARRGDVLGLARLAARLAGTRPPALSGFAREALMAELLRAYRDVAAEWPGRAERAGRGTAELAP